jgi:Na+:H+ antiporter, NhaA family
MANHEQSYGSVRDVDPPGTWAAGRRLIKRALAPVERFLAIEAASGIVLLLAASAALIWANSPWRDSYEGLWHLPLAVKFAQWSFERSLHFWINDGLMTVFFFVVGLEIRREIHRGELSELKRAALPLLAALGGMLMPAVIFLLFNAGSTARGWGVPMATDIAFAVGVLALLGKRVPPAVRVLLLALAVIDDVGSIVVIALFYSSDFAVSGFLVVGAGMATTVLLQRFGVRAPLAYLAPAAAVWTGAYVAGVHPTLAGVIMGLMTPVRASLHRERFLESADASVAALREQEPLDEHGMLRHLDELNQARKEAVSPVERLQHLLHGWVAFGVMPIFAFANAGVSVGGVTLAGDSLAVFSGIGIGLLVGKPLGIVALSWLGVRLGLAALPLGVRWRHVAVVGLAGGIGFTMAVFIAQLAFAVGPLLETAKLSILVASGGAGLIALLAGRFLLPAGLAQAGAPSPREAEASTAS